MLALKLGQSLNNIKNGAWLPTNQTDCEVWYSKGVGVTESGSPNFKVSKWDDLSGNNNHLAQANLSHQPTYGTGADKGIITFDSSNTENLETTSQISLSGDFTIGVALNLTAGGGVLLGDNTANGEFFRFFSTSVIRIKIDNATAVDISKDSGTFLGKAYMVLTRRSDIITLYWNGTAQTDTEELTGTADIDNLGVRKADTNPYDGTVSEVMIFSSSSAALTSLVNNRLALSYL